MYLNKVFLIGNLTRDPELKAIPSGTKVAALGLATNRTWKDQSGARKESTEYHNVVAFGRQAETLAQYARKGSSLYIEGRLQTRSWDGADGKKNYRTEIILDNFQFGPKTASSGSPAAAPAHPAGASKEPELDTVEYPDEEINLEDIPF